MDEAPAPLFEVHLWVLPATTCDYPVLAIAQDGSALLSLGGHNLTFDWGIPKEAPGSRSVGSHLPRGRSVRQPPLR